MRILFQYLFPLLLPAAVYLVWTWIAGKQRRTSRGAAAMVRGAVVLADRRRLFPDAGGVLESRRLPAAVRPRATYVPPRSEGGRIIPGHIK